MSINLKYKKNKNILTYIIVILFIILGLAIIYSLWFIFNQANKKEMLNNPNIYNNILINDINVSNMSKEEAKLELDKLEINEKITLTYKDKQYIFNKSDFGVTLDKQQALDKAYNVGRTGSDKERINKIKSLEKDIEEISIERNIQEEVVKAKLEEISKDINIEAKNATLEKNNDTFNIIEGNNGISVDFEKTYKDLVDALLLQGDTNVEIIVNEVEPKYSSKYLSKVQDKIGSFSTKYTKKGESDANRITNMKVAASRINGTILYPGEVFSTIKKFGATTKSNGYKPAPTIINGKFVDEYGGGVCQVSSTLYNAVLYSELEIVERQNHSLKVGYLDYGYDAVLAGDYIDFKFKNSNQYPIYIESYLTDNEVICNIYGYEERPKNRTLKFENALVEVIEPSPKIVKETDELAEGKEKVEVKPLKGYKYKLYKLVYIDNKLTEKVLINNSYYKPRTEEVLVGTKKVEQVINLDEKNSIKNNVNTTQISNEKIEETSIETTTESNLDLIIVDETINTETTSEETIESSHTE
ncbi:VanW family protein [[Clostridium] colinum]|uniref:VanW family protein n=1 Tax=[Clostridium] colinum TaxID=36835 RepID=UPI002024434C|nr:VanW family protein [[Clostridium] colinum]